ncbi:MAG: transporter [Rhodospirillales bacterium]|nr:transporter [Rhodospirillales bacterium]
MKLSRFLLSGVVLSLAACNLAPDYHAPPVEVPTTYKEAGPWQKAQPSDALPRGAWWASYGDETLSALEPQIEAANFDLAAAVARYDQARAFAVQAQSGEYPQVNLNASFSANKQSATRPLRGAASPTTYGANQLGASASYEVDLWGKIRNAAAAGRALAQASAADVAFARLSLQTELATDYFSLRGLDADAKLLNETVVAYQKAYDLTRQLLSGKIVADIDVSRAETQLRMARAQVSDVAARRALLEHAIASLIGKPASEFSIPVKVLAFKLPAEPAGVPSVLLQRRPDIAAAERNVMAANAEIGVARAAFYPSISLGLLGGTQSTGLGLLSASNSFWSLGPSISMPLFDGGNLEGQESGAYAKFREAGATYRSTVLGAFQQVEDNLALLHWLGQEAVDEDAAVKAAQHTLDQAFTLYRQGTTSYLEVVIAQTALLQAQLTALDLQTRRFSANVALVSAVGGGWDVASLPTEDEVLQLAPNSLETNAPAQAKSGIIGKVGHWLGLSSSK